MALVAVLLVGPRAAAAEGASGFGDAIERGRVALLAGDAERALAAAAEATEAALPGDRRARSEALALRARALMHTGALGEADATLRQAMTWLVHTPHTDLLTRIMVATGELRRIEGRTAEARAAFSEAERWANATDAVDDPERLLEEGRLFAFSGRPTAAFERYQRSRMACGEARIGLRTRRGTELERQACRARASAAAAELQVEVGDLTAARLGLEAALAPLGAAHWEVARLVALTALARVHLAFGDTRLAALTAGEARALAVSVGGALLSAQTLLVSAEVALARGEPAAAGAMLDEARAAWTRLGSPAGVGASQRLLATIALRDVRSSDAALEAARVGLLQAAAIAQSLDDAAGIAASQALLAELARREDATDRELGHIRAALARGPAPRLAAKLWERSGQIALEAGDGIAASRCFEAAVDAGERLPLMRITGTELDAARAERQAMFDQLLAAYARQARASGDERARASWIRKALVSSERSAARAFMDLLARSRALHEAPDADRVFRELAALEHAQGGLAGLALQGDETSLRDLEHMRKRRALLEAQLLGLAPSALLARGLDGVEVAIDALEQRLDDDTAALAYHLAPTESYLFVITSEASELITLPARDVLEPMVERFVQAVMTAPQLRRPALRRALERDGEALYQALIAPALAAIGKRDHLVLVPHRALRVLPFDTLPTGAGPLLKRFSTQSVPSLTALVALERSLAEKAGRPRHPIAAFADPIDATPELSLPRLTATAREVETAARLLEGPTATRLAGAVFLGEQATEGRLKRLALARYRVLHLATHGVAPDAFGLGLGTREGAGAQRPGSTEQPVLFLGPDESDDGRLTIDEVLGLSLDANLVVLSACSSGRGTLDPGDGLGGLVNAFLHAGSAAVLATLWPIEDRYAAALMERFYGRLSRDERPSAALRSARLALIEGAAFTGDNGARTLRGLGGVTGDDGPPPAKGRATPARRALDPFFWGAWVITGATGEALR